MKILIIGSGGREHAIGWKIKQSKRQTMLFFAPGNGGTSGIGENLNIEADDLKSLLKFVKNNKVDLTIVGPENALALGIVDLFEKNRLKIFGPTKKASRLESSKVWSARFMKKYHIPSPEFEVFSDYNKVKKYLILNSWSNSVIKADGLALGKGVIVPESEKQALEGVKSLMHGKKIVIQEKLIGQEVSLVTFCDGKTIVPLLPAQDHKRINDNDKGLNTGGVGAYTPVPFVSKTIFNKIKATILAPILKGLQNENLNYKGILYVGLMLTDGGPKVLEFNVRFGDPETQPQLLLMKSDLLDVLEACINRKLNKTKIAFYNEYAVCVVLTAKGYPGKYETGKEIKGLSNIKNPKVFVFHAGTIKKNKIIYSRGGRVLGVTARGPDLNTAISNAYGEIGINGINFPGMHFRKDIGRKAL